VPGAPTRIVSAGASRPGPHHLNNEDAWRIYATPALRPGGLFVVCDGVSTSGKGAWAARLACERLGQFGDGLGPLHEDELVQLVSEIDWELRGAGRRAACTLAAAWVTEHHATILTVGDSPVYRLRRGRLKQAGTEQTGAFRRLQAYLGMGPSVSEQLIVERWPLEAGDALMIMSDGVIDALDEDDLVDLWDRHRSPDRFVRSTLEEVARIGVDDDATILAVEVAVDPRATAPSDPLAAPDPLRLFRED
jgi:serine/threonine protein phosphatase PrpC